MKQEKSFSPISGYFMIFSVLILILAGVFGLAVIHHPAFVIAILAAIFMIPGFVIVNPNQSVVLILFGEYKGTVKANGFFWVNPFFSKRKVSLRARNLDSDPIKVNDKIGNPIMIGVVLVWRVRDTFKATFDVNDYSNFVAIQSEAAIRGMAGSYPYDNFEDEQAEITLRSGGNEVSELLERELSERLEIAGIEVMEARINYLAYASEIAGAMLRRQQATAVVAARFKIVEGAVSMVEMALEQLKEKDVIELDEDKKATMVSSLMVVLCSDKDATPVLNTGSLYQ
ncbi:regulator of protease activity HflC (stomatin/prohibitin superfamily) [Ancylomarina subtilis]|uniref:Regulator of protease activity HflC (Stomatin/prohibitin superfamily) n=1 Tax=Ancylomarina subtilis TaxID=1639035 RepID=A0A4Q7VJZ5_9BACT|nr:SPFH domain-containing protein [Ancylomarina subtilis]RZT96540.1 regulator of protease activity HflC (stomatin/prohibitin superfamily) [Ancylomarina subtilis]